MLEIENTKPGVGGTMPAYELTCCPVIVRPMPPSSAPAAQGRSKAPATRTPGKPIRLLIRGPALAVMEVGRRSARRGPHAEEMREGILHHGMQVLAIPNYHTANGTSITTWGTREAARTDRPRPCAWAPSTPSTPGRKGGSRPWYLPKPEEAVARKHHRAAKALDLNGIRRYKSMRSSHAEEDHENFTENACPCHARPGRRRRCGTES